MRVLIVLTYYRPHVSGLTIYAERLARALARRGHAVTVLTSQYDRTLPREEIMNGVRVVRVPVVLRISKGVIMPTFPIVASRLIREHDIVSVHLPQFEASLLGVLGRLHHRPVILTYHCDLQLPAGRFNRLVDEVVYISNRIAGIAADAIVAYTEDYAIHSRFLSRLLPKVRVIPPPVELPPPAEDAIQAFAERHRLNGHRVIGMAARMATEKGVEYLVEALPGVLEIFPETRVLFAGPYENVLGEEAYAARLMPLIRQWPDHWTFLGTLNPQQMAAFFPNLDCLVVSSINSTESFGLVQIEAMMCGTPVVASNLPGVRQPIRMTGMGEVVAVGDASALAQALIQVLQNKEAYTRPRESIQDTFSPDAVAATYEKLFDELRRNRLSMAAS